MNDYYKKLYNEYNSDPEAFNRRTKEQEEATRMLKKQLKNFGKEVDDFLGRK